MPSQPVLVSHGGGRTRPPRHCSVGPTALSRRAAAEAGRASSGQTPDRASRGRFGTPGRPARHAAGATLHAVPASRAAWRWRQRQSGHPRRPRRLLAADQQMAKIPAAEYVGLEPGGHAERPAHPHWQPAILQRCGVGGRRRANRRRLRALLAQYRSESRYLCQGGCAQRGGQGRVCTGSRPARADYQMRSGVAGAQRRLEAGQLRIVQPGQGRLRRSGGRTSRCDIEHAPVVRAPAPSVELDGNDQACWTCYRGCGPSRVRVQVALGSAACISL